jgi:hypothetical protein
MISRSLPGGLVFVCSVEELTFNQTSFRLAKTDIRQGSFARSALPEVNTTMNPSDSLARPSSGYSFPLPVEATNSC